MVPSDRQNCLTCPMWCTDPPISRIAKAHITWLPKMSQSQALTIRAQPICSQLHPPFPPSSPTVPLMPRYSNRNPSPHPSPHPRNLPALKVRITDQFRPKDSPRSPLEPFRPTPSSGPYPRCLLTTPRTRRVGLAPSCSQTSCAVRPVPH